MGKSAEAYDETRMKNIGLERQQQETEDILMSYKEAIEIAQKALNTEEENSVVWRVADKIVDAYFRGSHHGITVMMKNLDKVGL
jgi:hypothetical protein